MSNYKSGHQDIDRLAVDVDFDYASTQTVTANGIQGTIQMTNNGVWHTLGGGASISRGITMNNTSIRSNSVVIFSLSKRGEAVNGAIIQGVYNIADGLCKWAGVNVSGANIADDAIIFINYHVVN